MLNGKERSNDKKKKEKFYGTLIICMAQKVSFVQLFVLIIIRFSFRLITLGDYLHFDVKISKIMTIFVDFKMEFGLTSSILIVV